IKPPGWYPSDGTKPEGFLPIPEVKAEEFVKYDPEVDKSFKAYSLIWFIIVLLISFGFIVFNPRMEFNHKAITGVWIIFSLLIINGILESKFWAWKLEWLRLITTPILMWKLFPYEIPVYTISVIIAFSALFLSKNKSKYNFE
ncbi:MAG: hypothetical protein KDK36_11540, partial [Leptospiraceae bacterium]|nr:hypothetical protein [Leptospiraceae bacterium]